MQIKLIDNSYFLSLVQLTVDMYSSISDNINTFQAVNTLVACINSGRDFTAIGLYDEDTLVGFVTGMSSTNTNIFTFTGIYVKDINSSSLKDMIDFSFTLIKEKGYSGWEAEATNDNISSILEKYGATIRHTMYEKEFD